MAIEITGIEANEALKFNNIHIESVSVTHPLPLNASSDSDYEISVTYWSYAEDSKGQIHLNGKAKRIKFKDKLKGKSGFLGVIRREVVKVIKEQHKMNININ